MNSAIAKTRNQPKCPSAEDWIKTWHMLTGQSYEEWVWQQQDGWQWRFREAAAVAAKARSRVGAAGWQ